jgi:hypothetical protein
MNDFHRTGMGQQFYQGTMPQLVEQLKQLNQTIKGLIHMHIQGKRLPMIRYEGASNLDVWRMDDGVALTLSTDDGTCWAGCQLTADQWRALVEHVNRQLDNK